MNRQFSQCSSSVILPQQKWLKASASGRKLPLPEIRNAHLTAFVRATESEAGPRGNDWMRAPCLTLIPEVHNWENFVNIFAAVSRWQIKWGKEDAGVWERGSQQFLVAEAEPSTLA